MSPAVGDFRSAQRSDFQNPNPSVQKHSTDSGISNTNFNPMNFSKLDFDCSKEAAHTVRPSRKKSVKIRKHSSCSGSVSSKHVNSTGKTLDFVFNASHSGSVCNPILGNTVSGGDGEQLSIGESLDVDMFQFTVGSTNNTKSGEKINLQDGFQSGNLNFGFSADETVDTGKVSERGAEKFVELNGLNFVFGANVNNGVMNSKLSSFGHGYGPDGVGLDVNESGSNGTEGTSGIDGFMKVNDFTNEVDSLLVNSISGLNLGTGEPRDIAPLMKSDSPKTKENNTSVSTNSVNLDFAFSDDKTQMKSDANLVFGTSGNSGKSTEGSGKDDFRTSSTEINLGDSVNKNIDDGKMFYDIKVNGLFNFGAQNKKRSSCKGRRKFNSKQMSNMKSEGVGSRDLSKKQNNNVDSVRDGNFNFVFGSHLGNAFSDTPQSEVFDESKTSNILDPTKINTLNNDSCSFLNNLFVFGSKERNTSSAKSEATALNQCKDAQKPDDVSKVSAFEEMGKSDTVIKKQNQPINQLKTEAELIKETAPSSSSTIHPGFVPNVHYSEAPPTNEAGIANNFNFSSNNGVFGTSFTGFNTPDINLASSFTTDLFPGLGKKLEFSKSNSVAQRKLKKAKTKLRQQGRNRQQGGCNLSKEVPQPFEEASGCSPMDFSPFGGAECVSNSTDPATSQVKNEDAVDTTEDLASNNISSSSSTSFGGTNVSARQQPYRKKYRMKTGQGLKFTIPKVSHAHESTSGNHTKASDQEICEKWRKRGNHAYKDGDLLEAEGCYSKGISSIQHTETPGFCIEPLLLCYSNRAAARMALGRLREGLKDCRIAASLDPSFVKANLRSANCHLLLGELEDASYNYNKCLESENIVCLDRRLAIEAADGLQKTQKVANSMMQSAEFLKQKTHESATIALEIITDALSLSCNSEKLLNMKGEALFVLGKHKDVVQLCEQTLDSAEKNFATESKLWRWSLMSKSYFHLGRLEMALDFVEKHEQLRSTTHESVDPKESLNPLAVTIRELLHCKNAGNEAFQNGKYTEAIEHYSAAISKSMESHSFAAVCFCNRAAAHQSLGEIVDAIGDCSTAIALDGTYPKAFSRRSALWEMIRDYKHAADDLQRFISILETLSGNGSVKDLRKARRRLSSIEENSKKERSLDLYLILGIKPSDAAAEVKKAYRKAALRHHPDKAGQVIARAESGSDGQKWKVITESIQMDADKLFKLIGEAYAVLSDSTKRSKYDLEEEMWEDMNTHASSSSSSSSRRASGCYHSPFETTNRRDSHYSTKSSGNYQYYYWEDSRTNYHDSYRRW